MTLHMRLIILAAAGAILAALCARSETPTCPYEPSACYFSDDYTSARARFRAAALGANATLHTLTLPIGGDLTIDQAAVLVVDDN